MTVTGRERIEQLKGELETLSARKEFYRQQRDKCFPLNDPDDNYYKLDAAWLRTVMQEKRLKERLAGMDESNTDETLIKYE